MFNFSEVFNNVFFLLILLATVDHIVDALFEHFTFELCGAHKMVVVAEARWLNLTRGYFILNRFRDDLQILIKCFMPVNARLSLKVYLSRDLILFQRLLDIFFIHKCILSVLRRFPRLLNKIFLEIESHHNTTLTMLKSLYGWQRDLL